MRKPSLALLFVGALVLSACGGDDAASNRAEPGTTDPPTDETNTTEMTTSDMSTSDPDDAAISPDLPGKPDVEIPSDTPTDLVVTVLRDGEGPEAVAGDTVVVDYVGVRSEDGTEFDNSYDAGQPFVVSLGAGGVIAGWDQGLIGAQAGSRLQLDIPAELAYGDQGAGGVIQPGDALTFVIDVRAVLASPDPADAPDVDVAASVGATDVTVEELVEGGGAEVVDDSTAFVHLIVYQGDNLTVLDNTWQDGGPIQLFVAEGQLIEGLYEGVLGMRTGGRRVVTIPFERAWGADGNASLGLPAGTDLILVIDLVATF